MHSIIPRSVVAMLAPVDARFKTIPFLQEIIVEVYEDGPNDHIQGEMHRADKLDERRYGFSGLNTDEILSSRYYRGGKS